MGSGFGHAGNWTVPRQLLVRSPKARNKVTDLPHHTSLLDVRAALPARADREEKEALRIFSLESALIECPPAYFSNRPTDVRAALMTVRDASGLLRRLLAGRRLPQRRPRPYGRRNREDDVRRQLCRP
jgi:hypothetical protein